MVGDDSIVHGLEILDKQFGFFTGKTGMLQGLIQGIYWGPNGALALIILLLA